MVSVPSRTIVEHVLEHLVPPIHATCGVKRSSKSKSRQTDR
jgi:hypothetical protein